MTRQLLMFATFAGIPDPDPDGALLPYAWRKANNHRGRFALTVGFLTVSSYAALDYFAVPWST